ncbi:hypothetical protein SBRY_40469 [Actinacidiphila bryophytorum]|uniref:Uncharacterized protein n=1 Tax=Actinacidiphila bryophytorum TaxID=1436133 RepID=A0A9W4H2Z8_9ACTN|nr:hypothetical protein SBRY_40469 [Actinacidiphila bryophytorum]
MTRDVSGSTFCSGKGFRPRPGRTTVRPPRAFFRRRTRLLPAGSCGGGTAPRLPRARARAGTAERPGPQVMAEPVRCLHPRAGARRPVAAVFRGRSTHTPGRPSRPGAVSRLLALTPSRSAPHPRHEREAPMTPRIRRATGLTEAGGPAVRRAHLGALRQRRSRRPGRIGLPEGDPLLLRPLIAHPVGCGTPGACRRRSR